MIPFNFTGRYWIKLSKHSFFSWWLWPPSCHIIVRYIYSLPSSFALGLNWIFLPQHCERADPLLLRSSCCIMLLVIYWLFKTSNKVLVYPHRKVLLKKPAVHKTNPNIVFLIYGYVYIYKWLYFISITVTQFNLKNHNCLYYFSLLFYLWLHII